MWQRFVAVLFVLLFAFGVLVISVLRTAEVKYKFNSSTSSSKTTLEKRNSKIDYYLVFPGRVLPDSPFWPVKAVRDRIWLWITTNPSRKAELYLLLADKRLGASKILFEQGKPEVGFSTLTKAEKYLESATNKEKENREKGIETTEFLQRLARASLKHFEIIQEIYELAPEEAKPMIIEVEFYPKKAFEEARNALLGKGSRPPENPFGW